MWQMDVLALAATVLETVLLIYYGRLFIHIQKIAVGHAALMLEAQLMLQKEACYVQAANGICVKEAITKTIQGILKKVVKNIYVKLTIHGSHTAEIFAMQKV